MSVLAGDVSVSWDGTRGDLRLDYAHDGLARVLVSGGGRARPLLLLLADDTTAATFWRQDTAAGPVLVRGPALVRDATVHGRALALSGDTRAASDLEVWAPADVKNVTWNGTPVETAPNTSGSLATTTQLAGPPDVVLPALGGWKYRYETPEAQPGFDDSGWTIADRTSSNSITPIPAGQKDLFADDYGFHHGDVWYRAHYSGAATSVTLRYASGAVGMLQAWDDGVFVGSHQLPTPTPSQATAPIESATVTFTLPPSSQTPGDHVLSVLVRVMAHDEDGGANDAFKSARGLTSATLDGSDVSSPEWRIQGDAGGEDIADTVRGPLNNGGLYGERAGWYLPGFPDENWTPVSLPYADATPGVAWYRTKFDLHEPHGIDASLGLTISDTPTKAYRALIFLNGWNLGQYINNVGPQHTFVLPNGILKAQGANTLAIAVTTNDPGERRARHGRADEPRNRREQPPRGERGLAGVRGRLMVRPRLSRLWRPAARLALLVVLVVLASASSQRPHEASAAPQVHTVGYDHYSLTIDGKRLYVWSGEFHYWRLPSPDLWRDVLQKMKAAGFNAVSIYFDWAYHSPRPGVYDFSGIRDVDRLLDMAADVGLYVIARPGPYINAETDSGGFPGWLATQKGRARSSAPDFQAASDEWLHHIDPIIARHQLTNGTGTVIVYQVENEYGSNTDPAYMVHTEQVVRDDGITVPLMHNHCCGSATWATGPGAVDLPGQDSLPARLQLLEPDAVERRRRAAALPRRRADHHARVPGRVVRSRGAARATTSAASSPAPTSSASSTRTTSRSERRCRAST